MIGQWLAINLKMTEQKSFRIRLSTPLVFHYSVFTRSTPFFIFLLFCLGSRYVRYGRTTDTRKHVRSSLCQFAVDATARSILLATLSIFVSKEYPVLISLSCKVTRICTCKKNNLAFVSRHLYYTNHSLDVSPSRRRHPADFAAVSIAGWLVLLFPGPLLAFLLSPEILRLPPWNNFSRSS